MTATNHTEHYELSQYTEDDRPTYTGDYNGDMNKIDAAIYAASQSGGADLAGDGTPTEPLGVAVRSTARAEDYAAWLSKTPSGLCVGIMPQSGLGFRVGGGFDRLIKKSIVMELRYRQAVINGCR